jgi:hypothetical protein
VDLLWKGCPVTYKWWVVWGVRREIGFEGASVRAACLLRARLGWGRSSVGLLRQVDAVLDVCLFYSSGAARGPSKLQIGLIVFFSFFYQGLVSRFTEIFSSKLGFTFLANIQSWDSVFLPHHI